MARLTPDQWDAVKADYALGRYTTRELGEKHGVSHVAIINRVKAEGWATLEPETVNTYVKTKAAMIEAERDIVEITEGYQVNAHLLTTALDDLATFEIESNRIMARIDAKALEMLDFVDRPNDVKAIMDVHQKHREARLGKSPETAIQINNHNGGDAQSAVLAAIRAKYQ